LLQHFHVVYQTKLLIYFKGGKLFWPFPDGRAPRVRSVLPSHYSIPRIALLPWSAAMAEAVEMAAPRSSHKIAHRDQGKNDDNKNERVL
jgi:hypothetical protein